MIGLLKSAKPAVPESDNSPKPQPPAKTMKSQLLGGSLTLLAG